MSTICTSGSVVEYRLAKARVAGSNPVSCFFYFLNVMYRAGAKVSCSIVLCTRPHKEVFRRCRMRAAQASRRQKRLATYSIVQCGVRYIFGLCQTMHRPKRSVEAIAKPYERSTVSNKIKTRTGYRKYFFVESLI